MIQYDSRKVQPGDTFVAIPGLKHDGVDFIPQAIANGAAMIVAEKEVPLPAGIKFEKVPSARQALAYLSDKFYNHPSRKLKLIGITGTKGKTTTSYLIQSIINTAGYKCGLIGTITSAMTTPESSDLQAELAAMVEGGCTHCVLEVSSHALAQDRVYGCYFTVAIFTNLSHDHLDYHKTMEEYLLAKQKLFEMLDQNSTAIINVDDPVSASIIGLIKGEVVPYGIDQARHELRSTKHNEYDVEVAGITIHEDEMILKLNTTEIRTPLIGIHNVYNIAAAFQCALTLGIGPTIIKRGIEAVRVIAGRQEEVVCGQVFRVIVDFAHSPDSLEKVLQTYRPFTKGRLIVVFGCPGDRDREKRPIMGEIASRLADQVIITTDDPYSEEPAQIVDEVFSGTSRYASRVMRILDRRAAIDKALQSAVKGDIVLIAGRGHEKFQDFKGKKIAFDDKEVIKEILCTRK